NNLKKLLITSTSETYGTAQYAPIDEKHPLQGQSPYSASKIGADKLAESYFLSFNLPVSIVRPFNTFGPRQSARAVIPTIISQILSGKTTIKLGSLSPVRDFTFVKDTARAFVMSAESEKNIGEIVNFGTGKGVTIQEVKEMIEKIIGRKIAVECDKQRIRPEKSEVFKLICDNKKAKRITGWKPEYSLEEGIKETIDFIREHLDLYKPDIYNI
ncbi:MAG: GDP-mannose 4,6-dehydratase, partial [Patescibacteria group bacterium]